MIAARDLAVTPPGARDPVARGITLEVRAGQWIALAGPNGGGKTSLLLTLAGLWPAGSGTLELDGRPFGPEHRGRSAGAIGVVLQEPWSQILSATVGEELAFTAGNLGQSADAIARAVARWSAALGLEGELGRDPATLSAGRQQLVVLGAALVPGPRFLLADEPTAHLDARGRERVRGLLAAEVAAGLALVTATQDADELAMATRTLMVGSPSPLAIAPQAPPDCAAGDQRLCLLVAPPDDAGGPRVDVREPLTIEVSAPRVTALSGANGVGKSVLLAAAAGLEPQPQVTVAWDVPPALSAIAALQYPELQVFEEMVADELAYASVARGLGRSEALAAAARMLEGMGFEPDGFMARRTWTLSTGEKRVIEVIAALSAPAGLVILDEPTAGLDETRRRVLADLVATRARSGPVLVASQDSAWLAALGARVYRLGV